MNKQKKCECCGQVIINQEIEPISVLNFATDEKVKNVELVGEIKKKVISEVMNVIQPLLDKLQKIIEDNKSNETQDPLLAQQQQLLQLQTETQKNLKDRLKNREQSLAFRMKKFQSKISPKS